MSLSMYLFEGLNLLLDRVSVQGLRNSNRSVSQYYLQTSTDNVNFNEIEKGGRARVKQLSNISLLFFISLLLNIV